MYDATALFNVVSLFDAKSRSVLESGSVSTDTPLVPIPRSPLLFLPEAILTTFSPVLVILLVSLFMQTVRVRPELRPHDFPPVIPVCIRFGHNEIVLTLFCNETEWQEEVKALSRVKGAEEGEVK